MPRILLVEDDRYYAQSLMSVLGDAGHEVVSKRDATAGLAAFEAEPDKFAAIVLDMAMPPGSRFSQAEARSGFHAGLALARAIRRQRPDIRLVGLTSFPDAQISRWFNERGFLFLLKDKTASDLLVDHLNLGKPAGTSDRICFIVHGHDTPALSDLKIFIHNQLPGYSPVVLAEARSGGLTVIEKFEQYADRAFIAFVLMTPDDGVVDASGAVISRRARQNVIFELGYFLGRQGRSSGRALILTKGAVEIPSDIAGMVRIDISKGFAACEAEIVRELRIS